MSSMPVKTNTIDDLFSGRRETLNSSTTRAAPLPGSLLARLLAWCWTLLTDYLICFVSLVLNLRSHLQLVFLLSFEREPVGISRSRRRRRRRAEKPLCSQLGEREREHSTLILPNLEIKATFNFNAESFIIGAKHNVALRYSRRVPTKDRTSWAEQVNDINRYSTTGGTSMIHTHLLACFSMSSRFVNVMQMRY